MKISGLILTAALLMCACSVNDVINVPVIDEVPIGFNVGSVDNVTRGVNFGDMGEKSGDMAANENTFEVWAWKHGKDNSTIQIFDDEYVEYHSDSEQATTKWEYGPPLRYWDRTAWYEFYAASSSGYVFDIDSDTKLFSYFIDDDKGLYGIVYPMYLGNSVFDALVADKVTCSKGQANQGNASDNNVEFTFHHILSKLNVLVKTRNGFSDNGDSIVLISLHIYFGGLCRQYRQAESGRVSLADSWSDSIPILAKADCASSTRKISWTSTTAQESFTARDTAQLLVSYLVAPTSTASGAQPNRLFLDAEYEIVYSNGKTETFTVPLTEIVTDRDKPALPEFKQGYCYDLTVTIAPLGIYFNVNQYNDFSKGTGTEVTVN